MLISFQHKFILVSPLKAASTSLEKALAPYAEIKLLQTRYGKHFDLRSIERNFHWIFKSSPLKDFKKISMIRDPTGFLISLYNSHKHEKFKELGALYTGNLTFDDFCASWMPAFPEQCRPQASRFTNSNGNFDIDFVVRFEALEGDFAKLLEFLALPPKHLDWENRSPLGLNSTDLSKEQVDWIKAKYDEDYKIIERLNLGAEARAPQSWELIT